MGGAGGGGGGGSGFIVLQKGDERQQRVRLGLSAAPRPSAAVASIIEVDKGVRGVCVCGAGGRGVTQREFLVPLQACWNLLGLVLCCQAADKRPNNKNWYLYGRKWLLLFFLGGGWYLYISPRRRRCLLLLSAGKERTLFCVRLCMCVCVSLRVCAGMLFLGKPNKDEEGGWIQAASVSGAKGHPAVAWRGSGEEEREVRIKKCKYV